MPYMEYEKQSGDGIVLFFRLWKPEDKAKAVICLVHGLGEHGGRYSHWAELLNQANFAVVLYDLRGHGKSSGKRGDVSSFEEYRKDTDLLLKEAKEKYPDSPAFLYGHSLGGLIVNDYVLHRKPKLNGVIVTALSNRTSLQNQKIKIILSRIIGTVMPKFSLSSGLVPETICNDPQVVQNYINDPLVHHQVTAGWGKSVLESITWTELYASEWTLPVLYMHGEQDKLAFIEGTKLFAAKINADCTVKTWPGMAHEIHNEPDKQQVFSFLLTWLNNHLKQ